MSQFNKYFGLKWYERFNPRLLVILLFTTLFTFIAVVITANYDFDELNDRTREIWRDRYIRMASTFIVEPEPSPEPQLIIEDSSRTAMIQPSPAESAEDARARHRRIIEHEVSSEGILAELSNQDPYSDLPIPDDLVAFSDEDIIIDAETAHKSGRLFSGNLNGRQNRNIRRTEDPSATPSIYELKRHGNMMIEFTDELIGKKQEETIGYRNPDEINRVLQHYRPMIEHCFSKEARLISGLRGYVKVKFSISFEGYVIPESIRIVGSTIQSRSVEQCIKNYIKRWRNFEKLDKSMGIAQVVRKFSFN